MLCRVSQMHSQSLTVRIFLFPLGLAVVIVVHESAVQGERSSPSDHTTPLAVRAAAHNNSIVTQLETIEMNKHSQIGGTVVFGETEKSLARIYLHLFDLCIVPATTKWICICRGGRSHSNTETQRDSSLPTSSSSATLMPSASL